MILAAIVMKDQALDLILVIPPNRGNEILFDDNNFEALYDYVTGFSLMTYDFSNPHRPGKKFSNYLICFPISVLWKKFSVKLQ